MATTGEKSLYDTCLPFVRMGARKETWKKKCRVEEGEYQRWSMEGYEDDLVYCSYLPFSLPLR